MRLSLLFLSVIFLLSCSHTGTTKYAGFGIESISQKHLAQYAPPAPSSELKNKIEKLVDLRSATAGLLSKDGRNLYVNWSVTGSNQIWKITNPKSFPLQMTGGEDGTVLVDISANDKWLVVRRDTKGDENYGLYLLSTSGGPLQKIYAHPKQQANFGFFTTDSKTIYYSVNDKSPSSYTVYKYSLETNSSDIVWEEPGLWNLHDIKGDIALLEKNIGSMQNEHYLLNLKTKKLSPLLGVGEKEDFSIYFAQEQNEYIVLTNKLSDLRQIYRYKNGQFVPLTSEVKFDINSFAISHDRSKLVYQINANGNLTTQLLDLKSNKKTSLDPLKNALQTTLGRITSNNRYVTLTSEQHDQPRRNFVVDLNSLRSVEWTSISSPEINTQGFVAPTLEYYDAADGNKIPMFVWRPQQCEKVSCPVIVNFHGGPESQAIPRFNPIYSLYNEKGFIYVTPNVRGSDGYGKKWLMADNGKNRLNVITDIRDCSIYIKKHWKKNGVEPKIGITGGSYGGYSTLVGVSLFAEHFDAGAAIVGMSNLLTFLENTAPYRRQLRVNEYGDPEKDRQALIELSPSTYSQKVKAPVLIAHGATDPRVPVGEALQFFKTIQSQNAKSQLVIFPDEGHGVSKRPNIVLLNSYLIDFFEKTLK